MVLDPESQWEKNRARAEVIEQFSKENIRYFLVQNVILLMFKKFNIQTVRRTALFSMYPLHYGLKQQNNSADNNSTGKNDKKESGFANRDRNQ